VRTFSHKLTLHKIKGILGTFSLPGRRPKSLPGAVCDALFGRQSGDSMPAIDDAPGVGLVVVPGGPIDPMALPSALPGSAPALSVSHEAPTIWTNLSTANRLKNPKLAAYPT